MATFMHSMRLVLRVMALLAHNCVDLMLHPALQWQLVAGAIPVVHPVSGCYAYDGPTLPTVGR